MKSIQSVLATLALLLLSSIAWAQEGSTAPVTLSIEAQPMADALNQWAQRTGFQLIFPEEDATAGIVSPRLQGTYTPRVALVRLLENSGLSYEFINERTVAIRAKAVTTGDTVSPATTDAAIKLAQSENPGSALDKEGNASSGQADGEKSSSSSKDGQEIGPSKSIPEILVKGSRVHNMDLVRTRDDAQAYYISDGKVIEQSAALNVEDFLKARVSMNTTAVTNSQMPVNYLGNTSAINLRGLGSNQTLVLVDGRRTAGPAAFGSTNQADINGIPMAAIERIEVLPSSAAAIYGGSAVGGVVNVILKRNYEGGSVKALYENTAEADAPIRTIDAAYGASFENGRTRVMLGMHYSDAEALYNQDRPGLMQRGIANILSNNPALLYSPGSPFRVGTTPNIGSSNGSNLVLKNNTALGSPITHVPTGHSSTSNPSAFVTNAGSYNVNLADVVSLPTGLQSIIGSAPTVESYLATVRREMTDRLELFAEFFHSNNRVEYPYNPFADTYLVPASAPTNPFLQAVRVSFPSTLSVPFKTESTNRRVVAGFLLKLPGEWSLESDYTYNRNELTYDSTTFVAAPFNAALAAGTINPFVDTLAYPLDLAPYFQPYGYSAPSTLKNVALRVSGPLPKLPAGEPTLTVGLEHRKEANGDGIFYRYSNTYPLLDDVRNYLGHSQTTLSAYTEAKIPLLSERKGARLLDLQLALRTERYSVGTGTLFRYESGANIALNTPIVSERVDYSSTNPTIGIRYQPLESLMFRASYATGFLPPGYSQLQPSIQDARNLNIITVIDPLRGNSAQAVSYLNGGNPDLEPQKSKNWNAGIVFEPHFLPGARFGLEWYRINQKNVIFSPNAQLIVSNESQFPGRVQRSAPTAGDPYSVGPITFVDYTLLNVNTLRTEGLDFTVELRKATQGFGEFSLALQGTLIGKYERQTTLNAPLQDIVDQVAVGGPLGLRGSGSLRWDWHSWAVGWAAHYMGSYEQYLVGTNNSYVLAQGSSTVPNQIYHDLFFQYRPLGTSSAGGSGAWGDRILSGVNIQFGLKNVFNKAPPFDAYSNLTQNYYSPFGNARMRSYWLSVAKEF